MKHPGHLKGLKACGIRLATSGYEWGYSGGMYGTMTHISDSVIELVPWKVHIIQNRKQWQLMVVIDLGE